MHSCSIPYITKSTLRIGICIFKTKRTVDDVLIDTGFIHSIFGLKLPDSYKQFASPIYTSKIFLADTTEVKLQYTECNITEVEGHILKKNILVKAIFMKGMPIIGTNYLRLCKACFDGPNSKTDIDFDY